MYDIADDVSHNALNLPEEYTVDFSETMYPMSVDQELKLLEWKLANGVMTQKDVLLYFNKDMSEEELQEKLGEIQEEQAPPEPQQPQPQQPTFEGLRRLGTIT